MTVETELATLTTSVEGFVALAETKKEILDTQTALGVGHQDSARTAELTAEAHEEAAKLALESAYQNNRSIDSIYTQNLNAIAGTKTESAVDVFVYDTSKDSDGGAWRNRTQHTSWYNEPLNTSTRGSRKEFPVIAIIVAEQYKLTVYDGDDPSMPMWIIFAAGTNSPRNTGWFNYGGLSSVVALNADILFTQPSGIEDARGLLGVNFVKDELTRRDGGRLNFGRKVSDRAINNAGMENNTDLSQKLVDSTVNDVAITVLPGAPIDRDTRLPVPTVAVTTTDGTSVIQNDGTIENITNTNYGTGYSTIIDFLDNKYIISQGQGDHVRVGIATISPASHVAFISSPVTNPANNHYRVPHKGVYDISSLKDSTFAIGGASGSGLGGGVTLININSENLRRSMSAQLGATYNTGWMNGDMKLATLSDTDTTDITGTNLIVNGDFQTTRRNLLTQTEDLDSNEWSKYQSGLTGDFIMSPKGVQNAEHFVANTVDTTHAVYQSVVASATAHTLSVYAKAGGYGYLVIRTPGIVRAWFNLNTGATGNSTYASSITDEGDGWYRCSVVIPTLSSGNVEFEIADADGNQILEGTTQAGNGTSGIYLWGAQLEAGEVVTEYQRIKTTTNLLAYTESFDDNYWFKAGNAAVTANQGYSPDGTNTADKITFVQQYSHVGRNNVVVTTGSVVTLSVYLKRVSGNADLNIRANSSGTIYNCPITITSEWARYEVTFTHDGTNDIGFIVQDRNASGWGDILIWGAQVEMGTTATDYQPVTTDDWDTSGIYSTEYWSPLENETNEFGTTLGTIAVRGSATGENWPKAFQTFTTVSGLYYTLSAYVDTSNAPSGARVSLSVSTAYGGNPTTIIPANVTGVYSVSFQASSTTSYVLLGPQTNNTTDTVVFDDVVVTISEQNRSTNSSNLQVFGTITKDPVATGAELVAYSGFSTSNYLKADDAIIPRGDSSWSWWSKDSVSDKQQFYIGDPASQGNAAGNAGLTVWAFAGMKIRFCGQNKDLTTSNSNIISGAWNHYCITSDNNRVYIYVNGVLAFSGTSDRNAFTNTGFYIGRGYFTSNGSDGMALFKVSANAASPSQVEKMYLDEKELFKENAACTLYGTNDAVYSLAYDEDTDLLHASTSQGRSVFKGLQRVSNTTESSFISISASNNLVVED